MSDYKELNVQKEGIPQYEETTAKIRLTKNELASIKQTAVKVFGNGVKVWVFGSRVKPNLKGGDIDIYIEADNIRKSFSKKINFLVKLKNKIGDQKIDVIIKPLNYDDYIAKEVKNTGAII